MTVACLLPPTVFCFSAYVWIDFSSTAGFLSFVRDWFFVVSTLAAICFPVQLAALIPVRASFDGFKLTDFDVYTKILEMSSGSSKPVAEGATFLQVSFFTNYFQPAVLGPLYLGDPSSSNPENPFGWFVSVRRLLTSATGNNSVTYIAMGTFGTYIAFCSLRDLLQGKFAFDVWLGLFVTHWFFLPPLQRYVDECRAEVAKTKSREAGRVSKTRFTGRSCYVQMVDSRPFLPDDEDFEADPEDD